MSYEATKEPACLAGSKRPLFSSNRLNPPTIGSTTKRASEHELVRDLSEVFGAKKFAGGVNIPCYLWANSCELAWLDGKTTLRCASSNVYLTNKFEVVDVYFFHM